jgi:hypothetical protein
VVPPDPSPHAHIGLGVLYSDLVNAAIDGREDLPHSLDSITQIPVGQRSATPAAMARWGVGFLVSLVLSVAVAADIPASSPTVTVLWVDDVTLDATSVTTGLQIQSDSSSSRSRAGRISVSLAANGMRIGLVLPSRESIDPSRRVCGCVRVWVRVGCAWVGGWVGTCACACASRARSARLTNLPQTSDFCVVSTRAPAHAVWDGTTCKRCRSPRPTSQ